MKQRTRRKLLGVLLALALVLGLVPGMNLKALADDVDITVLSGTNFDSGEGCEKLFDNNTDTKWLSNLDGNSNPGVVICCPFFAFPDVPHLNQIHACAHIHTCDTLFASEAMALACFSFGKISKNPLKSAPGFAII